MTSADQPRATQVAAALEAARVGDDCAPGLLDAATSGEEVIVPLVADGPSPMGMTDDDGPALVAFTDLKRLVWAFPDGPTVALVPFGSMLAAAVNAVRPLRVDPTSPTELRIETQAAAALLEGRAPDSGLTHAGSAFEAPDPPGSGRGPEVVVDADEPSPHGEVRYIAAPDGTDPLSVEDARRQHEAGKPYAAVVIHAGHEIVVRVSAEGVVSERRDDTGRPTVIAGFRALHGRLLHDYLETREYSDESGDPDSRTIIRYEPEGTMRVWLGGDGAMDTIDSSGVELSWVPPVAFGEYRWVLDPR